MAKKTESILIWEHIRVRFNCNKIFPHLYRQAHASIMYTLGVNPIELLLWSRNKKLNQVVALVDRILRNPDDVDFTNRSFQMKSYLSDFENGYGRAIEIHDEETQAEESVLASEAQNDMVDEFHCPENDCKFSTNIKKTENLTEHLSLEEIIMSHMAIKHGVSDYVVSSEVVKLWCGIIED